MSNKNSERGRVHRDFLWYLAYQGLAKWSYLFDYSNMIPCEECRAHFFQWHATKIISDFEGSDKQMQMLYSLYKKIQHHNDRPAKDFDTRFLFYFDRLIIND